jgi:DNA-binding response OmpR family regulator
MRVLIVDDHQQVRRSVREALDRTLAPVVCGEAGGADEALQRICEERWDLVLLDLSLPDRSGMEALRELRQRQPALPVVVMSMHPESQFGAAARAAGAAGYLAKGADPETLAAAVRGALRHGPFHPTLASEPGRLTPAQRSWLGHVLHDELAQALAAVKINLQLARTATDPAEWQRRTSESLILLDQAIESVRQLSARLRVDQPEKEPAP